ncbi:hypothetical protein ACWT_4180 [Actinoplanes sp. SE50]|nr:hypothetical protein ACPL_4309 [Actinoplanes sp. SE50/110]ATO83595.1 hypothetical protein ACWT_4180 [Actinoplanes sp. SE50]SLM01002.1 hypothetical protein ACSP50_4235 [Actinoplanes sp. SE50/110]
MWSCHPLRCHSGTSRAIGRPARKLWRFHRGAGPFRRAHHAELNGFRQIEMAESGQLPGVVWIGEPNQVSRGPIRPW